MRLEHKVALITGAGSGIGRAMAFLFAQEGARVIVADRDRSGGGDTVAAIHQRGGEALFVQGDVTREADAKRIVEAAVTAYGRLDILVNNAGVELGGTVVDVTEDDWDRLMAVNLRGVFLCSKYAIPAMQARGAGVILNIASTLGLVGGHDCAAYCASKGAVVALTRAMALDHAADGIRVNCLCPGPVDTPLLHRFTSADELEEIRQTLPLGRLAMPEEIASAALYLVSDEASFVTGAIWTVDGGSTAQ